MRRLTMAVAILLLSVTEGLSHGPYTHWQTENGGSCCNEKDCRQAQIRYEQGRLQVLHEGEWLDVPREAVRPYESPDGASHACIMGKTVLCVVLGTGV